MFFSVLGCAMCYCNSCHIMPYYPISYHIISRDMMSCLFLISCSVIAAGPVRCDIINAICDVVSCFALQCDGGSSYAMQFNATQCNAMSCNAM